MKTKTRIAVYKMIKIHPQMIGDEIIIDGNSMFPTFMNGERVKVDLDVSNIIVGDIILYQQFITHLTAHRVVKVVEKKGTIFYVTKGDNNKDCDQYLVSPDMIIAKIVGSSSRKHMSPMSNKKKSIN